MQVKDIMKNPVVTVSRDADLNQAAQLMWENDCGSIPVVDPDGRLAGIITDRDVCMAAYTQGEPLRAISVATAMAPHVLVCHVDDSLETADELMREGQVRRVPVIDHDGCVVGIVALNDMARLALQTRRAALDRQVIETLAAVGAQRLRQELRSAEDVRSA